MSMRSKRVTIAALLAAAPFALAPDCTGREHMNVRPSEEEMDEQRRDEAQTELEAEVGEAAREEELRDELE